MHIQLRAVDLPIVKNVVRYPMKGPVRRVYNRSTRNFKFCSERV